MAETHRPARTANPAAFGQERPPSDADRFTFSPAQKFSQIPRGCKFPCRNRPVSAASHADETNRGPGSGPDPDSCRQPPAMEDPLAEMHPRRPTEPCRVLARRNVGHGHRNACTTCAPIEHPRCTQHLGPAQNSSKIPRHLLPMNSIQKDIAVSSLTHAIAGVVRMLSGKSSVYLRLRLNPRDFAWSSPEICYLDSSNRAAYIPRAETNPATAAMIVYLARSLADSLPCFPKPSSAPASIQLEAQDIGGRWLVNIKVLTTLPAPDRDVESTYCCRIRCVPHNSVSLAA